MHKARIIQLTSGGRLVGLSSKRGRKNMWRLCPFRGISAAVAIKFSPDRVDIALEIGVRSLY
ncbi:MAG: hypothetical protein EBZ18_05030 [Alphaproteobacteria bacterium]|nr:hypothetical protein [Alphaproteobacteria bacterium]